MKIYKESDFAKKDFWAIVCPGYGPGETTADVRRRTEKILQESGVNPIAETDQKLQLGDTIEINGELYHIGICGSERCFVGEPVEIEENPDELQGENELCCPYCGALTPDTFEFPDDGEQRCWRCGSLFHFEREIEIRWNSCPIERANIRRIS